MKPIAWVINLDRRPERWARMQERWLPYFTLNRVPAETGFNGAHGCKLSHLKAANLGDPEMTVVLEDDAVPTQSWNERGFEYLLEAMTHLNEWDMVNGGPYLDLSCIRKPVAKLFRTTSPDFLQADYSHQTHFMLYSKRSLAWLKLALESSLPLDEFFGQSVPRVWVPRRLLAIQEDGPSDIRQFHADSSALYRRSQEMINNAFNT